MNVTLTVDDVIALITTAARVDLNVNDDIKFKQFVFRMRDINNEFRAVRFSTGADPDVKVEILD